MSNQSSNKTIARLDEIILRFTSSKLKSMNPWQISNAASFFKKTQIFSQQKKKGKEQTLNYIIISNLYKHCPDIEIVHCEWCVDLHGELHCLFVRYSYCSRKAVHSPQPVFILKYDIGISKYLNC
jgi:hypothetical protein